MVLDFSDPGNTINLKCCLAALNAFLFKTFEKLLFYVIGLHNRPVHHHQHEDHVQIPYNEGVFAYIADVQKRTLVYFDISHPFYLWLRVKITIHFTGCLWSAIQSLMETRGWTTVADA